jgi:hypothetical protein
MITFKNFLSEKTMNQKTFDDAKARLESVALVGFEFEVVVEPSSYLFEAGDSEPDWNSLRNTDLSDLDELETYFDIHRSDYRSMDNEYESWLEGQKEDWIEQNFDQYVDDDTDEDEAREKAKTVWYDEEVDNYDKDAWFKEEFGSMYYLFDHFNISPKYGWRDPNPRDPDYYMAEPGDGASFQDTAENTATYLTRYGIETGVGDPGPDYAHWGIVEDGSLPSDTDIGQGLEIISPPQAPSKAFEDMEKFFKFMEQYDITTTPECGLHIGVTTINDFSPTRPPSDWIFVGLLIPSADRKRSKATDNSFGATGFNRKSKA